MVGRCRGQTAEEGSKKARWMTMALWKRGDWYWADFTVNGTRYRVPLHTSDRREAQRLEKEKIGEAQGGKLAPSSLNFARLGFTEAADRHLQERKHGLPRYSIRTEQERSRPLKIYLGTTPLNRISADTVREYIMWRKNQKPQKGSGTEISNRTVKMEVAFLRRLFKRAKRLHLVADDLKRLPER